MEDASTTASLEPTIKQDNNKKIWKIIIPILTILIIAIVIFVAFKLAKRSSDETVSSSGGATSAFTDEERSKLLEDYNQDDDGLTLNSSNWSYDSSNGVYYQIGASYLTNAESSNETLGIYVPAEYLNCKSAGNSLYSCEVDESGEKSDYTAKTAPIVIPVNTPGYSAQSAPSTYSYNTVKSYIEAGFIYLFPGIRGRAGMSGGPGRNNSTASTDTASGGAPYGVTDLKAAVRYYRFNSNLLPGDSNKIISFGHSGGGAQSAILGASGDSTLYYPYLTSLGAAMTDIDGNLISDAIYGSMDWCPITSLDIADAAYEWNMGQFSTSGARANGTFTGELSDDLAKAFAEYINDIELKDDNGNVLTLEESSNGIYLAGSYYDYLLAEIKTSYQNYLSDNSGASATAPTSLEDFVSAHKSASKTVGAFDSPEGKQTENNVFGDGNSSYSHFDSFESNLINDNSSKYSSLSGWDSSYPSSFATDLSATDSLGISTKTRVDMYNPMYFLSDYYDGYGSSNVAKYWRIRSGIEQGDTALTTELNLKLALNQIGSVEDVDFAMVWGKGHTEAERTGSATGNFISWVKSITK